MQEVLRLKRVSTNILSQYSAEPNTSISIMENKLKTLEVDLEKAKAVTESLQLAFKNLQPTISDKPVTKPLPGLQPASNLKVFGKIDKDEQLQEAIGKGGKMI